MTIAVDWDVKYHFKQFKNENIFYWPLSMLINEQMNWFVCSVVRNLDLGLVSTSLLFQENHFDGQRVIYL